MFTFLFYLLVAVPLVVIVAMIVRAVKITNVTIAKSGLGGVGASHGTIRRAVDQIRSRDIRCPRCGEQAFAMLGQDGLWMCKSDTCRFEFQGPAHLPGAAASARE